MANEIREIYYQKGVLVIFLEICQKPFFNEDIEYFLIFLNLLKFIAKGNKLFHESNNGVYDFIVKHFKVLNAKSDLKVIVEVLNCLLEISVGKKFELKKSSYLISEELALCSYFRILVECFKSRIGESNKHLRAHVIPPLEILTKSLMNCIKLSNISIQKHLLKILKRAEDKEFQSQISRQIGTITSMHTTQHQIKFFLTSLTKKPNLNFLDILIDCILGNSIKDIYMFSGNSFISLKTPIICSTPGILWTGYIRYECKASKQCVFSLLNAKSNKVKGIELYIENRKLVYSLIKVDSSNSSKVIVVPGVEVAEDCWYRVTMGHVGNSFQVILNEYLCIMEIDGDYFPKEYTCASIGASLDPMTGRGEHQFFGKMSALHFFVPTPSFKTFIKDLSTVDFQSLANSITKSIIYNTTTLSFQVNSPIKEFELTTHFIIDPKLSVFDKERIQQTGKVTSINVIKSLNGTKVIYNKPAREIFYSLGGIRTAILLLANQLTLNSEQE